MLQSSSELPTEVIRSVIIETVEEKLKSKTYNIDLSSASKSGEINFIGIVHRISFSKEDADENDQKAIEKMILKVAPQNLSCRNMFKTRDLFLREIHMYDKVLPYFRHFEQSKGVVIEDNGFNEYPKFYRAVDIDLSECILLEDLCVRGFNMIDRSEDVSAEHVCLVMQCLGKFHAISFALKDQQPDKFRELTSDLPELYIRCDEQPSREFCTLSMQAVLDVIFSEEDDILRLKLKKLLERDAIDAAYDCVNADFAEPATVISHGDAWQNNIMFKYDDNKTPIGVCLLDWQLSRHSAPIIDIVFYIFCCTTKELRDVHYDEFLKIYHESLSTHIQKLGSNPEKLFPYKLMREHFCKFGKFGLFISAMLLPMITSESGHGIDLDVLANRFESDVKSKENIFITDRTRDKFNKRIRDVVVDMARLNYI